MAASSVVRGWYVEGLGGRAPNGWVGCVCGKAPAAGDLQGTWLDSAARGQAERLQQ